jgi:hypothetical protein
MPRQAAASERTPLSVGDCGTRCDARCTAVRARCPFTNLSFSSRWICRPPLPLAAFTRGQIGCIGSVQAVRG